MRVSPRDVRLAVVLLLVGVMPAAALAAQPKPGKFKGREHIPYNKLKTQPLSFTVGGNGRKIFAFDVPACQVRESPQVIRTLRSPRVLRPAVSRSGHISAKLQYTTGNPLNKFTNWSIRVSGKFVTPARARGRISISAISKRHPKKSPPETPDQPYGKPCKASGKWSARHR